MYVRKPSGRKVLKPGSQMSGKRTQVTINSMGFRGPELASPKPENGIRIWVVGGSTTFDVFAPDDAHTWPALLQAKLTAARPDRVIEVINAGIPGEMIAGNQEDFEQHAAKVKPDVLVYYHGPNDLRDVRFGGPPPPSGELEQQFALLRVARGAINQRAPQLPEAWRDVRPSSHDLNEMTSRIDELLGAARRHGAKVLMSSHAFQYTEGKMGEEALSELGELCVLMQMYPDNVVHLYRDYNQMVRGLAERRNLPFADVQAAVPSDSMYWGDSLHFTAAGSELAAQVMTDTLLASGWL
jgi:lysophospholipase L1-like esterase